MLEISTTNKTSRDRLQIRVGEHSAYM